VKLPPRQVSPSLTRRQLLLGSAGLVFGRSLFAQSLAAMNAKLAGDLYPVHDPCIIKEGDTFYVFCTTPRRDTPKQIPWYTSKDLFTWKRGGHVFDALPGWARGAVPKTEMCWAPDISYVNEQFLLYYACSSFGSNTSAIGLATTPTLNREDARFRWTDRGVVLKSQSSDDYNAIDPNHIVDRDGKHWLAFGSFWSGLKLMALDPASGMPASDAKVIAIAQRPKAPDAIEGVFVISRAGYYYLFASFDFCCRGADSSYYTVVGRSKDIQGPYVDKSGKPLLEGGGSLVLAAGPGELRWMGPGHCAILRDEGKDYIVYHAYDAAHDGRPTLRIAPLGWTDDNWPAAFV
jgi:arabinan endo-1,5-alpha-L-arabinosidase